MKAISALCLFFILTNCGNSNDQSTLDKEATDKSVEPTSLLKEMIYKQKEGRDVLATLSLHKDWFFEFEDTRDESCWVWSTTFGKWHFEGDTLILTAKKDSNSIARSLSREFLLRGDSLIYVNPRERNRDINWGNFKLNKE